VQAQAALDNADLQQMAQRFDDQDRDLSHLLVGLTQTELFWQE
jgi:hypothetical protein